MLHIIRQQHLHVELNGSESDGLALQRRLPGLCQDWLLPALERTLDRFAPPEGSLYIERLEIDAGVMSLDRLEHDLADAAAQALEKALREQTAADTRPAAAERASGNAQRKTVQQSVSEAFVFFLETGQLPWSFRLPEGRSLEQAVLDVWENAAQAEGSVPAATAVLRQVLASVAARKRLTRQFTPTLLKTLLAQLAPETATAAEQVLAVLRPALLPADIRHVERLVWDSAFAKAAEGNLVRTEELVSEMLPHVAAEYPAAADVLARHWPLASASTPEAADGPEISRAAAQPGRTAELLLLPDDTPAAPSKPFPAQKQPAKPAPQIVPAASPVHLIARQELPDLAEGIYVSNAGLVLLHPFLPQFFGKLGMVADKKLLQPERALCLLHFLATGQPVAPEFELMLPKVLCNVPLEIPVEADAALTAAEQDETVALLKAVIQHWDALRNTSPDGLRGTFFVRPGKISLRDADWLLQVEPQTWDILLDQLPWGIGMIKLPWMERMLHVEWI